MSDIPGHKAAPSPSALAGLVFRMRRAAYLVSRGLLTLRVRGLGPTLERVRRELLPARQPPREDFQAQLRDDGRPLTFDPVDAPGASIIVPIHGHLAMTLDCLRSIARSGDRCAFEVILVDDASPDGPYAELEAVPGLRVHRLPRNQGFIGACNAGAALARAPVLVFLNNDTLVLPGWLDALVDTFGQHPGTGLVGARLLYPDGRLQEAGGLVFGDASAWNYGRFDDADDPRYTHVRDVDYCSGAAIAVQRPLFESLQGFDPAFAPAYYEDTDLAMRVRQRGLRVLYQPASRVVHLEGATGGTDVTRGVKSAQVRNQALFLERWREVLAREHPATHEAPDLARDRQALARVLVIDVQVPRPDRDSGSLRMLNLLRLLRGMGCSVSFLPDSREREGDYATALEQLGVEVWSRQWLGQVPRWFALHGHRFDLVIASRHYVASSYAPLVRQHAPRALLAFDTVDLHFLREAREAEVGGAPRGAERTRQRELAMIAAADLSFVVSSHERELLAGLLPEADVRVLSNVHRVSGRRVGFAERRDIVFVGGFRHPPNVDAVLWLVQAIWPRVREALPDVALHVVGGDVPDHVAVLAGEPGVEVHGYLPDIEPLMDGCRLAVAPLRYGAGVKGKINLSMAHGQPVVSTACGVEGMHLDPGVDVLVADQADAFAEAVVAAYTDQALWMQLSEAGLDNVRRHFSFEAAQAVLEPVLDAARLRRRSRA